MILTEMLRLFSSVEFLLDPQVVYITLPEESRGKFPKPSTKNFVYNMSTSQNMILCNKRFKLFEIKIVKTK